MGVVCNSNTNRSIYPRNEKVIKYKHNATIIKQQHDKKGKLSCEEFIVYELSTL